MRSAFFSLLVVAAACGDDASSMPDAGPLVPTANPAREIVDTKLSFDIGATTGTARITFGASETPGATLEVGELAITSVTIAGDVPLDFRMNAPDLTAKNADGATIDLALPASSEPIEVAISYMYRAHAGGFTGATAKGYTLIWPYYCGNLFPCHSAPSDGTSISLELTNVPADKVAVYPPMLAEAPSYQIAWSIEQYTEIDLGTTTAGTQVSVWHLPQGETAAMTGTQNLVAAFDWLEKTIGPYRFGNKVGSVSVRWGSGALGGMEHHPMWHLGSGAMASQETHVHEAVHGWFGDGIRIACWEDFVLSEGTTSYLAGRALDVVAPAVGAAVWDGYAAELASLEATEKVWPDGCNSIDILDDDLFTRAPYIRGAYFYRALAQKLGADVVDSVLAAFYAQHAGKAASMSDMLALIQTMTGYDPAACADTWLKAPAVPTAVAACP
ncbi:MAG: M1 family aminopeptidase [Kofleriaceae bacterium]